MFPILGAFTVHLFFWIKKEAGKRTPSLPGRLCWGVPCAGSAALPAEGRVLYPNRAPQAGGDFPHSLWKQAARRATEVCAACSGHLRGCWRTLRLPGAPRRGGVVALALVSPAAAVTCRAGDRQPPRRGAEGNPSDAGPADVMDTAAANPCLGGLLPQAVSPRAPRNHCCLCSGTDSSQHFLHRAAW